MSAFWRTSPVPLCLLFHSDDVVWLTIPPTRRRLLTQASDYPHSWKPADLSRFISHECSLIVDPSGHNFQLNTLLHLFLWQIPLKVFMLPLWALLTTCIDLLLLAKLWCSPGLCPWNCPLLPVSVSHQSHGFIYDWYSDDPLIHIIRRSFCRPALVFPVMCETCLGLNFLHFASHLIF